MTRNHSRIVSASHKCDVCEQEFKSKSGVSKHKKVVHYQHRLKCEDCEKYFTSNNALQHHLSSIHLGKTFDCDVCENSFT